MSSLDLESKTDVGIEKLYTNSVRQGEPKPSTSSSKLLNRSILCLFQVLLLWSTSLSIVFTIVDSFVPSPQYSYVEEECISTYRSIENQQKVYAACARAQSKQCSGMLDKAVSGERARVGLAELHNEEVISTLLMRTAASGRDYQSMVQSLQAWVESNPGVGLKYTNSCSASNKSYVQGTVEGYAISTNVVLTAAKSYGDSSDARVSRLAEFSRDSEKYNAHYLTNKLKDTRTSLFSYLNASEKLGQSIVNESRTGMHLIMADATSCLDINSTGSCKYGKSASEAYGKTDGTSNVF